MRATFKGFLRLSLVSVPIKAYVAHSDNDRVHLNNIHSTCHSRVQYKKVCPLHGELPGDEIVQGYEVSKNKFVVIDDDFHHSERSNILDVLAVVNEAQVSLSLLAGKLYYLEAEPAGKSLAMSLWDLLDEDCLYAVCRSNLHGAERLSVLMPLPDKVLGLQTLHWPSQVRKPDIDVGRVQLDRASHEMLRQLLEGLRKPHVDWSLFKDTEQDRLVEYIQAKAAGLEPVMADEPAAPVLSLMEALKKSVAAKVG